MQGIVDDDELHEWMLSQMKFYLEMKAKWGDKYEIRDDIPNFKHVSGNNQIELKIRKRLNQKQRHGFAYVNDLINPKLA